MPLSITDSRPYMISAMDPRSASPSSLRSVEVFVAVKDRADLSLSRDEVTALHDLLLQTAPAPTVLRDLQESFAALVKAMEQA